MMDETLDVVAVGAHPDDVEIGCGGTLASMVLQGYRVGIIDLTDGEPTPLCPSPDVRLQEAEQAAKALGVHYRKTLTLPNRRLMDGFEARVALATEFRRLRPKIVLALGNRTPLASPDHEQAMLIANAAIFYSRLTKWDQYFAGLSVHTIPCLLYYRLGFEPSPAGMQENNITVDIGKTLDRKLASIACYKTQFPPTKQYIFERCRALAVTAGVAAGFEAGEVLCYAKAVGVADLPNLLLHGASRSGTSQ